MGLHNDFNISSGLRRFVRSDRFAMALLQWTRILRCLRARSKQMAIPGAISVRKIRAECRRLPVIQIVLKPAQLRSDCFQPGFAQYEIRRRHLCFDGGDDRLCGACRISGLPPAIRRHLRAALASYGCVGVDRPARLLE